MTYILGLDPSIKKAGYVVLDVDKSDNVVEERGLLKTSTSDGILVQRLIKQVSQIESLIKSYNVTFIGMEAPFFGSNYTEQLYALNQFIHKLYLDYNIYAVCFPPQMLKKLVFPEGNVSEIHKPHMIDLAKTMLNLHGKSLAEDVADAYWAGIFGKRYFNWHIRKTLNDSGLNAYELYSFKGSHTFVKGDKKGQTEYSGIIYRENDLFFDFKEIKRRSENAPETDEKRSSARGKGTKSPRSEG
jgi:Holliday junction resolvasome RuvABC endonuclease subunit